MTVISVLKALPGILARLILLFVVGIPLIASGVLALAWGGLVVTGTQIISWMRDGIWVETSTKTKLAESHFLNYDDPLIRDYVGLNKIAEWIMDFHPFWFFGAIWLFFYTLIKMMNLDGD